LNGHGGNDVVREKLVEISNRFKDLRLIWYSWWQSNSVEALAMKHKLTPEHANWMEAFQFNRVADLPKGSKPPVSYV
jgi:creatinine amidohydrolase/Fe(II)-dependent formamide hydrolase-like protein